MKSNKAAVLSAVTMLLLAISFAAGREVPPILPGDNILRKRDVNMKYHGQKGAFSESKGFAVREPIFHPIGGQPCDAKAVDAKGEKLC
ncbi:unnamed protein product [Alopecurus aequalis]